MVRRVIVRLLKMGYSKYQHNGQKLTPFQHGRVFLTVRDKHAPVVVRMLRGIGGVYGELFRDASKSCGMEILAVKESELIRKAAEMLSLEPGEIMNHVAVAQVGRCKIHRGPRMKSWQPLSVV